MIDGLRPKMTLLEPTSQRNAKAATAATSPSTGGILEQLSIDPAPVQVSTPRYSGKQSDVPFDCSKVDSIRDAIRSNTYPIDFQKLADRMIEVDFQAVAH
jgi:anti-sigma28 factor (negative regulator of flagellin synthesis)